MDEGIEAAARVRDIFDDVVARGFRAEAVRGASDGEIDTWAAAQGVFAGWCVEEADERGIGHGMRDPEGMLVVVEGWHQRVFRRDRRQRPCGTRPADVGADRVRGGTQEL
ncbi:hypothetical protein ACPZ19_21600 [Amycolatopsis lurida]